MTEMGFNEILKDGGGFTVTITTLNQSCAIFQ